MSPLYQDVRYVFGSNNAKPASRENMGAGLGYGAGLDVSPALNGCLGFRELNGDTDIVNWQFVDAVDVPPGPWKRIVTTQGEVNKG